MTTKSPLPPKDSVPLILNPPKVPDKLVTRAAAKRQQEICRSFQSKKMEKQSASSEKATKKKESEPVKQRLNVPEAAIDKEKLNFLKKSPQNKKLKKSPTDPNAATPDPSTQVDMDLVRILLEILTVPDIEKTSLMEENKGEDTFSEGKMDPISDRNELTASAHDITCEDAKYSIEELAALGEPELRSDFFKDEETLETAMKDPSVRATGHSVVKLPLQLASLQIELDLFQEVQLPKKWEKLLEINWRVRTLDCQILFPAHYALIKGEVIGEVNYLSGGSTQSQHLLNISFPFKQVIEIFWLYPPAASDEYQREYGFKCKDLEHHVHDETIQYEAEPIMYDLKKTHCIWHKEIHSYNGAFRLDIQGTFRLMIDLFQSQYVKLKTL
nr:hypothetical protein [uncultured Bacillus sp.]